MRDSIAPGVALGALGVRGNMQLIRGLATLSLMSMPLVAQAAPADFAACDGYSAPGKKSDGITKGTWLWGLATATADFRKGTVAVGAGGITACDSALADPMLVDAFWLRRAHLLQSKALHQISAKLYTEALAALDQSDAAGATRGDAQFDKSIKLANMALRAMAYYKLDRKEDAHAALKAVTDARPWSTSLRLLTTNIRVFFEPDFQTHEALLREQAVLEPRQLYTLFWFAMARGDFEAASKFANEVSFDIPRTRGGWSVAGGDNRKYDLIRERASLAGATAYALAATEQLEASARAYKRGLDEIEAATQPPEPDARGRPPGKNAMREYALRNGAGAEAKASLQGWGQAIALRREAGTMTLKQLIEYRDRPKGEALMVAADFFRQLKPADLREASAVNEMIGLLQTQQDDARRKMVALNFNALIAQLPRPETTAMVPRMQPEGGNILRSDLNGWAVRKAEDPALVNVRFGSAVGSESLVEEAAFLAAANHVASLGKDGFIVEAGQLIQRTMYMVGIYSSGAATPSGYELRLLLRPVDTAALPAELETERWRIVKVRDVQASLAGKFPLPR